MERNLCIYRTRGYNLEKLMKLHDELFGTDFLYIGSADDNLFDRAIVGFEITTGALVYDYEKMYDLATPTKADWKAEGTTENYDDWSSGYASDIMNDIIRWMPYHSHSNPGSTIPFILDFSMNPAQNILATEDEEFCTITYVRKPYPKEAA